MNKPLFSGLHQTKRVAGFTIVEVLIALTLSLFLVAVAAQSYMLNKSAFTIVQQTSLVLEKLRFAAYYLNKEVRQAGNLGCFHSVVSHLDMSDSTSKKSSDLVSIFDISKPINVWSYAPQDARFDLSSEEAYSTPMDNGGAWSDGGNFPSTINRSRPAVLDGKAMVGSDILLVTKLSEPIDIRLSDANSLVSSTLALAIGTEHKLQSGQIVVVGDCNYSDMFVLDGQDPGALKYSESGNFLSSNKSFSKWQRSWGSQHEVRVLESTLFYIGQGANGDPSLFRMNVGRGLDHALNEPEEVVSGIEVMKVLVGEDVDKDKNIDQYVNITESISRANLLSLQVGILAVSDRSSTDSEAQGKVYRLTALNDVKSPLRYDGALDTRWRYVSNNVVKLRNQGLTRSADVAF